MTFGPNPGIWADAVRKALNPKDERAARAHETGAEQAELDKAELRELELSGVYGQTPPADEANVARQPRRPPGFLARLFRRSA
jgi:hypothetical protein